MPETITSAISDRICRHMNEDHSDALVLYVQVFGEQSTAETAQLQAIDPEGMDLMAQIKEEHVPVRIKFDHTLKDAEDAHHTLIEMVKQARQMKNAGT